MTTKRKDGGPAFPGAPALPMSSGEQRGEAGMSLRDWFAGQALAGLMAADTDGELWTHLARNAYLAADAMLAARSTRSDNQL